MEGPGPPGLPGPTPFSRGQRGRFWICRRSVKNIFNFIEINLFFKDICDSCPSIIVLNILEYKKNFIIFLVFSNKVYIES